MNEKRITLLIKLFCCLKKTGLNMISLSGIVSRESNDDAM